MKPYHTVFTSLLLTIILITTGCALNTPPPMIEPPPEATPSPDLPVAAFISTDYGLARYGLTFQYPENWQLMDLGNALALVDKDDPLTSIFFNTDALTNLEHDDPVAILNNEYPALAIGALKGEKTLLESPTALTVQDQPAAFMSFETMAATQTGTELVNAFIGIIVDEERYMLIQGLTLPENAARFEDTFRKIIDSIELVASSDKSTIETETVYQGIITDFGQENSYRLTATTDGPLTVIAKPEDKATMELSLLVYNDGLNTTENTLLARNDDIGVNDWAVLTFEAEQSHSYILELGYGLFAQPEDTFSFYVLSGVPAMQRSGQGQITTNTPAALNLEANVGEAYLIDVTPMSDVDIRFEIQTAEEKRLQSIDYKDEGEPETSVFVPPADDNYRLVIRLMKPDSETDYMVSIGEIGHLFAE